MKILKSLSKKYFFLIFLFFLISNSHAENEPVDIWNVDENKIQSNDLNTNLNEKTNDSITTETESTIFNMQSDKKISSIDLDEDLNSDNIRIFGLYDPEENSLDINMWSNSDGDQLKNIFNKLDKINLSKDASDIMKISMLTNAHIPKKNISEKEFLEFKSEWLIKNSDLDLIEEYLIKNQIFNIHPKLTKFLLDEYMSSFNVQKACEIFSKNQKPIDDEYLTKFNIYCLIKNNRVDEAQLIFDLKKELGLSDKYYEKKINYLLGYASEIDETISEKNILDFHLAHITNPKFFFEPKETTSKIIWKYLSSSGLLSSHEKIDILDLDKISTLEKATHDKNYPEKDLFQIYKKFQFDIDQLLNVDKSYKSLSNIEARALIYQKILLESELIEKLKLLKLLKNSFESDDKSLAFDDELRKFLEEIKPTDVPDNLTSFYYTNIKIKKKSETKIEFNNDVLHQSKLLNYFSGDYSKSKIEKDLNNYLKKIKKNKKYFFSKKDQIFLESLEYDGIKILDKYNGLYNKNNSEIPTDMQVMINNGEKGAALLRIVEVIGQDDLERMDEDTIYFIISTLNQLNIGLIRNKILLKVLPLKV